jgi:hypothetical protein
MAWLLVAALLLVAILSLAASAGLLMRGRHKAWIALALLGGASGALALWLLGYL